MKKQAANNTTLFETGNPTIAASGRLFLGKNDAAKEEDKQGGEFLQALLKRLDSFHTFPNVAFTSAVLIGKNKIAEHVDDEIQRGGFYRVSVIFQENDAVNYAEFTPAEFLATLATAKGSRENVDASFYDGVYSIGFHREIKGLKKKG